MKTLSVIVATFFLLLTVITARAADMKDTNPYYAYATCSSTTAATITWVCCYKGNDNNFWYALTNATNITGQSCSTLDSNLTNSKLCESASAILGLGTSPLSYSKKNTCTLKTYACTTASNSCITTN